MITPISNNLNTASSLSSIERPRVPRRNNAVDSVSFTGKGNFSTGKVVSNIKGFFGKAFDSTFIIRVFYNILPYWHFFQSKIMLFLKIYL